MDAVDGAQVVVVGAGGHGTDIAHFLNSLGIFAGFYDDHVYNDMTLGSLSDWRSDDRPWTVGVNDPVERARIVNQFAPKSDPFCRGVFAVYSTQGPNVTLGRHTHLGAGVTITRTTVGDFCTIAPGATICGDVTIGDGVMVGAGAVVSNLCEIGSFATLGAGAVVPPRTRVPAGETWVGVPAGPVS